MNPQLAKAVAEEHQRDLAGQARRHRMAASPRGPRRRVLAWRVPRYRVSWSRTTLSPAGLAGRRERSWVIVISATRAAALPRSANGANGML